MNSFMSSTIACIIFLPPRALPLTSISPSCVPMPIPQNLSFWAANPTIGDILPFLIRLWNEQSAKIVRLRSAILLASSTVSAKERPFSIESQMFATSRFKPVPADTELITSMFLSGCSCRISSKAVQALLKLPDNLSEIVTAMTLPSLAKASIQAWGDGQAVLVTAFAFSIPSSILGKSILSSSRSSSFPTEMTKGTDSYRIVSLNPSGCSLCRSQLESVTIFHFI